MTLKIERPDLNEPFNYAVHMDEGTLLLVMSAMNDKYAVIDMAISMHNQCNKIDPKGCDVHQNVHGFPGACDGELSALLIQQLDIINFLREARFVRENREIKSEASFRALEDEARRIRDTALRTLEPTGAYRVVEEKTQPAEVVSDSVTGKYEVDDEIVKRVQEGLKQNGVINAPTAD